MKREKSKKKLENKLTQRGEMLHEAHSRQQGNSPRHGETIVVGTDGNGDDIKITIGMRCSCGRRIRGANHLEGMHHKKRVPRCGNH